MKDKLTFTVALLLFFGCRLAEPTEAPQSESKVKLEVLSVEKVPKGVEVKIVLAKSGFVWTQSWDHWIYIGSFRIGHPWLEWDYIPYKGRVYPPVKEVTEYPAPPEGKEGRIEFVVRRVFPGDFVEIQSTQDANKKISIQVGENGLLLIYQGESLFAKVE